MKEIVFDTGKDIVKFKVDGVRVEIESSSTPQKFIANPETFEEQSNNKRALMEIRRKKGEKFYQEWRADMEKFSSFTTEEEVVDDIMNDFHKKRGWRLISNDIS